MAPVVSEEALSFVISVKANAAASGGGKGGLHCVERERVCFFSVAILASVLREEEEGAPPHHHHQL